MSQQPSCSGPGEKETDQTSPMNSGHKASLYLSQTDNPLIHLAPFNDCQQECKPQLITARTHITETQQSHDSNQDLVNNSVNRSGMRLSRKFPKNSTTP